MRRAAALSAVGGAYLLLFGFFAVLAISLTTAIADGWAVRQATQRHDDRSPRFSPDGSQIAWIRAGALGTELWVMEADGGNQQPLAAASRFRWSVGGGALLFSRGGPRVFVVTIDGGIPADAGRARLAPGAPSDRRGGREVFVRGHHLYLRLPDGSVRGLT